MLLSAVDELLHQLDDPATLHASEDADRYVALAPAERRQRAARSSRPSGSSSWTQQRAPLELLLQKVGGSTLDHPETVHASGPHVSGPDQDWFAPGTFVELSDADALTRKAFERLQGGVRFGVTGVDDGPARTLPVTVKQIRIPAPPTVAGTFVLPAWFAQATAARTGGAPGDRPTRPHAGRGDVDGPRGRRHRPPRRPQPGAGPPARPARCRPRWLSRRAT